MNINKALNKAKSYDYQLKKYTPIIESITSFLDSNNISSYRLTSDLIGKEVCRIKPYITCSTFNRNFFLEKGLILKDVTSDSNVIYLQTASGTLFTLDSVLDDDKWILTSELKAYFEQKNSH